jgi:hypothetical protein
VRHAPDFVIQPKRTGGPLIVLTIIALALAAVAVALALKWPFTRSAIVKALRDQAEGDVTIQQFHMTFFPRPGCVARGVVIHHGPDSTAPPLITVDRLTIAGDYSGLLTFSKHLDEIRTEGMHIRIPREQSHSNVKSSSSSTKTGISRFIAENAVLEFKPKEEGHEPFVIQIHRTVLSPASASTAMSFDASLRIPEPPGEVQAKAASARGIRAPRTTPPLREHTSSSMPISANSAGLRESSHPPALQWHHRSPRREWRYGYYGF